MIRNLYSAIDTSKVAESDQISEQKVDIWAKSSPNLYKSWPKMAIAVFTWKELFLKEALKGTSKSAQSGHTDCDT